MNSYFDEVTVLLKSRGKDVRKTVEPVKEIEEINKIQTTNSSFS